MLFNCLFGVNTLVTVAQFSDAQAEKAPAKKKLGGSKGGKKKKVKAETYKVSICANERLAMAAVRTPSCS